MTTALATLPDAATIEKVLIGGDLAKLTDTQRLAYYHAVCESVGLNPLTQPFAYIQLNNTLRLYALKDATDQLRKIHGVSVQKIDKQLDADLYIVTAYVADRSGRTDASTGAVTIGALKGEARANAIMQAETKAKRRATLSICGLGMLDETEAADLTAVEPVRVTDAPRLDAPPSVHAPAAAETLDTTTGEIVTTDAPGPTERGAAFHWIVRCEHLNGRGKKKGLVTFSDGTVATIWMSTPELYAACEAYCKAVAKVVPSFKHSDTWGLSLKAIQPYAGEGTHAPTPPVDVNASDIPF